MQRAVLVFVGSTAGALLLYAVGLMQMRKSRAVEGLHGTAHWAERHEIEDGGLLPKKGQQTKGGVYVGGWLDEKKRLQYLRHNGPEHVLAFAPTRSGKGVGLVIPTLLSWQGSVICYDIKGENWAMTAGWRKEHAKNIVMKFDPTAENDSVSFNPLDEIRLDTNKDVGDAQNIATMLVDADGKGLVDHWAKTSHALLTGAILHCCYKEKRENQPNATLTDIAALLSHPDIPFVDMLDIMIEYKHLDAGGELTTHPIVAQEVRAMKNKEARERSSVLSTAISYLTIYKDPIVANNTRRSDFRIIDLMDAPEPVSLYMVVRPSEADRVRPLLRLVITQILRRLTESLDPKNHRLLMMLDEFASLKRLVVMEEAIAFMAGFGIKAFLIVQDLQQIQSAYGREEGIIGNCHIRIAFAPNKIETAELLSRMSGTTTVIRRNTTVSGKRSGYFLGQVSESMQEQQRHLITADEAMRLQGPKKDGNDKIIEGGHMLIFVAGHAPIYGHQILYFKDPVFEARSQITAPKTSDSIHHSEPISFTNRDTPDVDFKKELDQLWTEKLGKTTET